MNSSFVPVGVFSLAAFSIGLSEFIVIGVLRNLVSEFDVTLSEVGLAVSIYALGISIGAPLITYVTRKIKAKGLCLGLILLFSGLAFLTSLANSFTIFLFFRALSGIIHGTFFSVASASIPDLVRKKDAPLAIALMFSGLTLAMVLGVPIGMLIVNHSDWSIPFIIIAILSCISGLLMMRIIPKNFGLPTFVDKPLRRSFHPKLLGLYFVTFFGFGGGFYFYSYAEPWLSHVGDMSGERIGLTLGIVGIGSLIGNILGGIIPQKIGLIKSLTIMLIVQIIGLTALNFLRLYLPIECFLFIWAVAAFAIAPMVQTTSISLTSGCSPRISASFNVMAFNLGISGFSYLSTQHVAWGGLEYLPISAAFFISIAVPIVILVLNKIKNSHEIIEPSSLSRY